MPEYYRYYIIIEISFRQ